MANDNYKLFESSSPEIPPFLIDSILESNNVNNLGDLIIAKQEELGISQRQLCSALKIERRSLQRIIDGEADKIDIILIIKLAQFFHLDVKDLVKFYISGIDSQEAKLLDESKKFGYILQNFDINALKRQGLIHSATDFYHIEERIKTYFGFNSIYEFSSFEGYVLFSRGNRVSSDKMLNFWLSTVNYQLKKINNPNEYDREKLKQVIPKLRACTLDIENGFRFFVKAMYDCGVTVIVSSYLSGTSIHGGTFFINQKPCIVLTNYLKRYDRLWFTLAHELKHVLFDLDLIKTQGYHLTGQNDIFKDDYIEKEADQFARDLLLPQDKYNLIKDLIDVQEIVKEYGQQWKVHPSIIYGFYLFENSNKHSFYKKYIPNTKKTLNNIEVNPWKTQTILKAVEISKKNLLN